LGREYCLLSLDYAISLFDATGPGGALERLRDGLEYAERRGSERFVLSYRGSLAGVLTRAGQWEEAIELDNELAVVFEGAGHRAFVVDTKAQLACMHARRGELHEAAELVAFCREAGGDLATDDYRSLWLEPAALLEFHRGPGGTLLSLVEEWMRSPLASAPGPFACEAASMAVACSALGVAESLTEMVRKRCRGQGQAAFPLFEHTLRTVEATLAAAHGDLETAATGFADAASRWHDFEMPYEEAQALLGQGRCLTALGRAPEATPPLEAARAIFARLGAKPALEETEALMRTG